MLQLSDSATLFVSAETDTGYQHTAGRVILDAGESRDFCFGKFRAFIDERMSPIPQFRWKLREVPFGLDLRYWVEDRRFSLDRHVHRIAVPAPGDMRALTELAGYLYSRRLDRSKTLWELWFIEGLEGNRFAILQKLHHCMMDGQGAQKIGEALCDFETDPPPRPIVYTSVTGAFDKLEEPKIENANLIAYTNGTSEDWETRKPYNKFKDDRRNSRIQKIMPHLFMDSEYSVYLDWKY